LRATTRRRIAVPAAITSGLLLSGLLVWHTSYAAFTASTSNPANTFGAGGVSLSDDKNGTAMFAATALKPGSTASQCINVTYTGTVASTVKLSAAYTDGTAASSGLAPYLDFTVQEIGAADDCTTPTGTLTAIDAADTTLAAKVTGGLAAPGASLGWSPSATSTKRYRFTYALQDNNSAQNKTASVGFTWTATSS
jgi:hypothetical protein